MKEKLAKYKEPITITFFLLVFLFYLILSVTYYFRYSLHDFDTAGEIFGLALVGVYCITLILIEKQAKIVTKIFLSICAAFFLSISVIIYIKSVRQYQSVENLIDTQQYVYAEYDHLESSYYTVLKYTDEKSGENFYFHTHTFKWKSQTPVKKDEAVKVYVDLSNPDLYLISYKDKEKLK